MDLVCASDASFGLIGSLYFFGWMASSMIIPTYADNYGRRKVVFGCCVISVLCAIVLLFSKHLLPTYIIMFVWGAIASGNFMVSSVYTTETCPTEW